MKMVPVHKFRWLYQHKLWIWNESTRTKWIRWMIKGLWLWISFLFTWVWSRVVSKSFQLFISSVWSWGTTSSSISTPCCASVNLVVSIFMALCRHYDHISPNVQTEHKWWKQMCNWVVELLGVEIAKGGGWEFHRGLVVVWVLAVGMRMH